MSGSGQKSHKLINRFMRFKTSQTRIGDLLVARGKIDQNDLNHALLKQQQTGEKLGAILVQENAISRYALFTTLSQQATTRFALLALGICLSFGGGKIGFAQAENTSLQLRPTNIAYNVAPQRQAASPQQRGLFGKGEVLSTNLSAFKKWTSVLARMSDRAHSDKALEAMFAPYGLGSIERLKTISMKERVEHINNVVNKITYRDDSVIYGQSDYWATPKETIARGQADCEDYAIAKYALLKAAGVPEHMMRVSIVKDTRKNIAHALLIVYHNDGSKDVLDNQSPDVRDASSISYYNPLYSINSQAWWRHI